MVKRLAIIGTVVLLSFALAKVLVSSAPTMGGDFFPLAKNNSWTHLVTFSGGDYLYYMTETVVKDDHVLSDATSYIVTEEYEPLTTTAPQARSTVAYFHKDGFLHRYPWLDSEKDKIWDTKLGEGAEQILPWPYHGEISWSMGMQTNAWPMHSGQDMKATAKASIDPEDVWVPAGVFRNCLRVETNTANQFMDRSNATQSYTLRHVEWYAKGVGLVRAISDEGEGTPVKSLTELVWYKVHQ